MKVRLLFALCALVGVVGLLPADAAQPPRTTEITITDDAGKKVSVKLVPRSQLRVKTNKRFSLNKVEPVKASVPAPPAEFDWTAKGGKKIPLPMHGNDRYGNCFYVAPCHVIESQLALIGAPLTFKDGDIVKAYLRLSPSDQGLSDDDILPEWKGGIVGGIGPYKLLDYALIDPKDATSFNTAMYYLGGCVSTHELQSQWEAVNGSGFVWDNASRPDPNAGHAIGQHGRKVVQSRSMSILSTWGMTGYMTSEAMGNSDAEIIAGVSTAWFDAKGFTPNGDHYDDVSAYWKAATGRTLPTGLYPVKPTPTPTPPGPPPTPPPSPTPTPGKGITGTETVVYRDGVVVSKTFTANTLPPLPTKAGETYTIDLSKHGPLIRARIMHRIAAHLDDSEHADYQYKDGKVIIAAKAGVDWNAFLDFLTKLLPIILQILAMFGA